MRSAIPSGSISNRYYRAVRENVEAILRTSQPTGRERRPRPQGIGIGAVPGNYARSGAAGGLEDKGLKRIAKNVRAQALGGVSEPRDHSVVPLVHSFVEDSLADRATVARQ